MQLKIPFFIISDFVKEIINETPTGGHYDCQWWGSRYSDLQSENRRKGGTGKLDFTFQDLMNEVLKYYKDDKTAIFLLTND